ncbi:chemotaxis protein CheW [Ahrensia marina]|jgi:purine-binding chemotaxis protein CheW|uniref:Chemotaxis protein CheW n=1 Tax=Ahrensia marina TaxID=1514904 RepID=A0A0N0E6K9_9HYPH|nr:chemotaxis protein CheW [Ahrensia marina]KPB00112.1 chemotaxis protein CheW [Ahrensia marina]
MSDVNTNHEEFIVFRVGEQEFCVEITSTREIRGWTPSTVLPHSPDYLLGVINLRGTILPIVDLAKRLGLHSEGPTERHVVIVVQVKDKMVGLLVNSVSDILEVKAEDLRDVPDLDNQASAEFFGRVVVLEERIICEVRLDRLVPDEVELAA